MKTHMYSCPEFCLQIIITITIFIMFRYNNFTYDKTKHCHYSIHSSSLWQLRSH